MLLSISVTFALTGLPNTGLPEGCRAPTQGEIDAGWKRGISICPTDIKRGFSEDVGAAKKYLFSIARNLRDSQAPPDWEHIKPLDPTFAVCAANFLKAYADERGPVAVVSACRSCPGGDPGENARAGGVPNSRHTKGLALDVNPIGRGSSYQTLWAFARQHPEYGVCFPHLGADPPHMTLTGADSREGNKCMRQSVTKICSGAPAPFSGAPGIGGSTGPTVPGGATPAPSLPLTVPPRIQNGTPTCPTGYVFFEDQCYLAEGDEFDGRRGLPFSQNQNPGGFPSQGGFPGSNALGQGGIGGLGGGSGGASSQGGVPSGLNRSDGSPIGVGQSGFPFSSAQQTTPRTLLPNTIPANILDRLNALTKASGITGTSSTSTVSGAQRDVLFSADFGTIADLGTTGTALGVHGERASGDSFGTPRVRIIAGTTFGASGANDAGTLSPAAPLSLIQSALLNIRSTLLGILAYLHLLR